VLLSLGTRCTSISNGSFIRTLQNTVPNAGMLVSGCLLLAFTALPGSMLSCFGSPSVEENMLNRVYFML